MKQEAQPGNPLHGITLETILNELVARHGWDELGRQIVIRCFTHEPSIASSLKFLRRTPWARQQVESLYLRRVQRKPAQIGRATTGNGSD
ncbi:MAG: VF530 family protein [Rhodocyclales bacterium]|nr:VF530 family protein [Rhodocyclales bacterium]